MTKLAPEEVCPSALVYERGGDISTFSCAAERITYLPADTASGASDSLLNGSIKLIRLVTLLLMAWH